MNKCDKYGRYSNEEMNFLSNFLKETYGVENYVLHEKVSNDIHLDVFIFPPTEKRDHWTLITMGMGAHPMDTNNPDIRYAELIIELPAYWRIDNESLNDEKWYWPIRALKGMARIPINHHTWLAYGHTMTSDESIKFHGTEFTAFILTYPVEAKDILRCTLPDGRIINYWQMIPLHQNELEFKSSCENRSSDELFYLLSSANVTGVIDIERPSVCHSK